MNSFFILFSISVYCFSQDASNDPLMSYSVNNLNSKPHFPVLPGAGRVENDQYAKNKTRQWIVGAGSVAAYAGSLLILERAWYANYPRRSFHVFNDNREWMQVDKIGHAWSAYNAGRGTAALWRWAGLPKKKAALVGGLSSTIYLTVIEFLDAHSVEWGWSWGDMVANITGSGLFIGQELGWEEQRVQFKFSFFKKNYDEAALDKRADELFGKSWNERMLKDYNTQTYWLSVNLKSFFKQSSLPAWLNVAVGYGAGGMFGGFENKWVDESGNDITRYDIPRKRQFYLAPDVDFTKIKTGKKWLQTTFFILNALKCPAPSVMIDSKGKMKGYLFYF